LKTPKARTPRGKAASLRRRPETIVGLVRRAVARYKAAKLTFAHGTTDPVAEAAFLVGETLRIPPERFERRAATRVTAGQQAKVLDLIEQRVRTRKPAAYLVRRIYMRGVPFYIDERAIVPRSYLGEILDSDLLSAVCDLDSIGRVLDLCTGSGCLAILAALRFPKAKVDAVELSKDALEVAKKNVTDPGLKRRVRLLRGDLFAPIKSARYDLIIANPPYVDKKGMARLPPECRYEPRLVLDGGADGLAVIRRIVDEAGRHLRKGGGLLCEVGRGRAALERAYPDKPFLWLDTEDSTGEVFWLGADHLR
jgi:ribosomal protein L3 glutamine methyltransferase